MVVRVSRSDPIPLAVAMLAVGGARHYAWDLFPPELRGIVSKALGGAAILALILIVLRLRFSVPMVLVVSWWAIEELQVVICSILFALKPWPVQAGQSLCSARIDVDLGSIGICVIGWLAFYFYRMQHGRTPSDPS